MWLRSHQKKRLKRHRHHTSIPQFQNQQKQRLEAFMAAESPETSSGSVTGSFSGISRNIVRKRHRSVLWLKNHLKHCLGVSKERSAALESPETASGNTQARSVAPEPAETASRTAACSKLGHVGFQHGVILGSKMIYVGLQHEGM